MTVDLVLLTDDNYTRPVKWAFSPCTPTKRAPDGCQSCGMQGPNFVTQYYPSGACWWAWPEVLAPRSWRSEEHTASAVFTTTIGSTQYDAHVHIGCGDTVELKAVDQFYLSYGRNKRNMFLHSYVFKMTSSVVCPRK